jgi:quinol-cytochrome oxidoreductase complex cytochrome b subunit
MLHSILVPDQIAGDLSLLRFYVLHAFVLPFTIMALSSLHFYRIRKNKGVLPYL